MGFNPGIQDWFNTQKVLNLIPHIDRLEEKLYDDLVLCCVRAQSYLTLCNLMDCSPPGSFVHRILQAGTLEWVAISPPGYDDHNRYITSI